MAMIGSPEEFPRPKQIPPASKRDLVAEAVALAGILLCAGLIIGGSAILPDRVPLHVGVSGTVDSYGSKWILLSLLFLAAGIGYGLTTIAGRYPYYLNVPVRITKDNAPVLYRLMRDMLRWIKVILVWMTVFVAGMFVLVLPAHPAQSQNVFIIVLAFPIVILAVIGYYVVKFVRVPA